MYLQAAKPPPSNTARTRTTMAAVAPADRDAPSDSGEAAFSAGTLSAGSVSPSSGVSWGASGSATPSFANRKAVPITRSL